MSDDVYRGETHEEFLARKAAEAEAAPDTATKRAKGVEDKGVGPGDSEGK